MTFALYYEHPITKRVVVQHFTCPGKVLARAFDVLMRGYKNVFWQEYRDDLDYPKEEGK